MKTDSGQKDSERLNVWFRDGEADDDFQQEHGESFVPESPFTPANSGPTPRQTRINPVTP